VNWPSAESIAAHTWTRTKKTAKASIASKRSSTTPLLRESQSAGEFLGEVLRIYHGHFWLFVKLTAPAVVVGYIAKFLIGGYIVGMFECSPSGWLVGFGPMFDCPLRVLTVPSLAGVTVVQPFLFTGFALLHIKMTALSSASNVGLAGQLT
jgi:hypothetical protein